MAIYQVTDEALSEVAAATFARERLLERRDLQRLLRDNIGALVADTLIIAEEFGRWTESSRRIDLLGVDRTGSLVVIELKRTDDGGHMELQALRYAAMVSTLTFEEAVETFAIYLRQRGREDDALQVLLDHLGWDQAEDAAFNQRVRIVLASMDFDKEITSTVLWLTTTCNLDIRCIRIKPYRLAEHLLVDVQQLVPLPEAAEYQVRIQRKAQAERVAGTTTRDLTKYDVTIDGATQTRLAKVRAIFLVVRHLCDHGVTPEQITRTIDYRTHTDLWRVAPGTLDAAAFRSALSAMRASEGRVYEAHRVFGGDGELIHCVGQTFAFTKMWSRDDFVIAMDRLRDANLVPDSTIEYAEGA
jgi:hypothetical protein